MYYLHNTFYKYTLHYVVHVVIETSLIGQWVMLALEILRSV